MFLRHERSQSCTRFFFRLICFFSSYSFPPREITVLWDDERTYYLYTRAILYAEQRRKKKKKSRIVLSVASNAYRERFGTGSKQFMRIDSTILSLSLSFFLSHSLPFCFFISLSLSLLNSKNKRGNFATVCKTNGKNFFFFSFFSFSSLKRSIL